MAGEESSQPLPSFAAKAASDEAMGRKERHDPEFMLVGVLSDTHGRLDPTVLELFSGSTMSSTPAMSATERSSSSFVSRHR